MFVKFVIYCSFLMFTADLLGLNCAGNKFAIKEDVCAIQNNKLLSLLNLLCNSTQNTSIVNRDACYGCFFRVANLPGGQTLLNTLNSCASLYLINTTFAGCANQLANLVSGVRPTTPPNNFNCYTGYCEFARCIRRQNAFNLIDGCFTENLFRDFTTQQGRVNFYTNVTACILARVRCNSYNPITGELQVSQPQFLKKGDVYLANSIQIAPTGDIRIVTFQPNIRVAELFCSVQPKLDQAGYGLTNC